MVLKRKKSILVTGAPRSGTTFLGKMLALPKHVMYVDEPLNYQTGIKGVERQFIFMNNQHPDNEQHASMVQALLSGKANFKASDLRDNQAKSYLRALARELFVSREHLMYKLGSLNPLKARYLIKDPMACFASEYLHQQFDFHTVIIIRHPASTIASFKRLNWRFSLGDLQQQSELMKNHLQPLIGHLKPTKVSDVEEWSHLWLSINQVLEKYAERNKNMIMVRHEDISRQPIKEFAGLYDILNLKFTTRIQERIKDHTGPSNPADPPGNAVHVLRRDSAKNLGRWKDILTKKEISIIKTITNPFASKYYAESEW
jgi:hypothetical protein